MTALMPYLIGFAAMSCYAILTPLAKKTQLDFPPFSFVAIAMGVLALSSAVFAYFFEKDFSYLSIKASAWGNILLFALVNLAGFVMYLMALKKISVTEYQLMYLVSPLIVAFFGYLLLGEAFKARYLVALLFMGIGLFIALYDSVKA